MPNIKARITNKHDTEANWALAENFKPLAGEVIVYDVDSNYAYPRFKVGDGKTLVSALPFSTDVLTSYVTETELASALNETTSAINKNIATIDDEVATHIAAINNPHQVNKAQVGLSNVADVLQYSASNPPPYGTLTFTGAVEDSFTASTSKIIEIPTIAGPTGPTGPTGANGANIVDITVTPTSTQIGGVSIPLINGITDANKILMVNNDGTSYELELLNNLTIENASNANMAQDSAKLGGVVAENYAQIDGTYSGMTVGAATKATQDGNGNNIVNTYAKKKYLHRLMIDLSDQFHIVFWFVDNNSTAIVTSTLISRMKSVYGNSEIPASGFTVGNLKGWVYGVAVAMNNNFYVRAARMNNNIVEDGAADFSVSSIGCVDVVTEI